jgi:hypothetical protein
MTIPPRRPTHEVIAGTPSHQLIRGVLRARLDAAHAQRVILYRSPVATISLLDSGDGDVIPATLNSGGDSTFQLLWARDETMASLSIDSVHFPIAPGDTMSVPAGHDILLAGGMLLVHIDAHTRTLDVVLPPNHGIESFVGYNRRTDYDSPSSFILQRWKITQPLTIAPAETPLMLVDLAAPLAIVWNSGTDLIGRGECRVVEPETGPVTLLPDGLGYALVVR